MRLLRHIQATLDKTLLSRQQPSQLTCADSSVKVVKYSENVACPQSWQIYECSCLIWLQAMIALLACSLEVAAAGVLTARKQFTFLVGAMVLTLGLVAVYCAAVRTYNWGLTGVWWGEWHLCLYRKTSLCSVGYPAMSSAAVGSVSELVSGQWTRVSKQVSSQNEGHA